jgi:hypothetical protein
VKRKRSTKMKKNMKRSTKMRRKGRPIKQVAREKRSSNS